MSDEFRYYHGFSQIPVPFVDCLIYAAGCIFSVIHSVAVPPSQPNSIIHSGRTGKLLCLRGSSRCTPLTKLLPLRSIQVLGPTHVVGVSTLDIGEVVSQVRVPIRRRETGKP